MSKPFFMHALLLSNTVLVSSSYATTTIPFPNPSVFDQETHVTSDPNGENEKVDFFKLAEKYNAINAAAPTASTGETANMSEYEKFQYYNSQNNVGAIQKSAAINQINNLDRAKKQGVISQDQYQQHLNKNPNLKKINDEPQLQFKFGD